ncbi:BlaI/MecI/CopY family transcriptional regulator [Bacillaceae bacterium SIJ1]|nr:BlaI/MecI/CopY family transcriptional regulator [Litoribacterium kuwaitense]
MNFIWKAKRSVTTKELMDQLPEARNWKRNTTITFLSRLKEKGFLTATRISKANHYAACITEAEYLDFETKQFISDIHNGSAFGLVNTLIDNKDLSKEDIELLMKRLEDS